MSSITMLSCDYMIHKDYYPYVLKSNQPKWFKNLNREDQYGGGLTYKACPALIESFKRIIVIPSWTDINLHFKDGRFERHEIAQHTNNLLNDPPLSHHPDWQHQGFKDDHFLIKFLSPWQMEIDGPSMVWITHPHFHDERRFEAATGLTDMSVQSSTHINTYWPEYDGVIEIKAGQPLAYIVPLIEDFKFDVQIVEKIELIERAKHIEYSLSKSQEYFRRKSSE